ncbi:hypothetical protein STEG23_033171, partial [Scotinomys teguina]
MPSLTCLCGTAALLLFLLTSVVLFPLAELLLGGFSCAVFWRRIDRRPFLVSILREDGRLYSFCSLSCSISEWLYENTVRFTFTESSPSYAKESVARTTEMEYCQSLTPRIRSSIPAVSKAGDLKLKDPVYFDTEATEQSEAKYEGEMFNLPRINEAEGSSIKLTKTASVRMAKITNAGIHFRKGEYFSIVN